MLSTSVKRRRLRHKDASVAVDSLNKISSSTDFEFGTRFIKELIELYQLYHIISYDAAYLELVRRKYEVMSHDEGLLAAAKSYGLK